MHKINVNKTTMRSRQLWYLQTLLIIKGNNIITEHRSIFQRERQNFISEQTDKISQQPENWENRNGPDLVQVFPKKWWVESDITAPNLPLPVAFTICRQRE
jgi:hypothetical protein